MCDSESVWINSNMLQLVNFCLLFGLPKLRVFQMTAKKLSDGFLGVRMYLKMGKNIMRVN